MTARTHRINWEYRGLKHLHIKKKHKYMFIGTKMLAYLTEGFTTWAINCCNWLYIFLCSHWITFFFFFFPSPAYIFESVFFFFEAIQIKASVLNQWQPWLRFRRDLLGFPLNMCWASRKFSFQRYERRCKFVLTAPTRVCKYVNTINIFYGKRGMIFHLVFSILASFTFISWILIMLLLMGSQSAKNTP